MKKTKLEEMVARHEGFRSKPYRCTAGKLTIGYGLNVEEGITEPEAHMIMSMRLKDLTKELGAKLPWFSHTDEERQGVLIDMAYQLGVGGLMKFKKFLVFCAREEWGSASVEMLDSKWAKSDSPNRAKELSHIIKSGAFRGLFNCTPWD